MTRTIPPRAPDRPDPAERGSALLLAVFGILILSLLALGLLGHSFLVTELASAERWAVKTFYAADSGLALAESRARIQQLAPFEYTLPDVRMYGAGGGVAEDITVQVAELMPTGAPRIVLLSEVSGGQGGEDPLVIKTYRTNSRARGQLTNAERELQVIFGVGPMPATLDD